MGGLVHKSCNPLPTPGCKPRRQLPLGLGGFAARAGLLALLLAPFLSPLPALAWSNAGHRVAATLAMTLLTAEAQTHAAALLDPDTTLADISTWADDLRPSRLNTGPWHIGNVPREAFG